MHDHDGPYDGHGRGRADTVSGNMPAPFDRLMGELEGLPDVVKSKPTTVRSVTPLVGQTETFIVQTVRQRDRGDFVFLEHVSHRGTVRIVLPPNVSDTIARQREAAALKWRQKVGRDAAADRKERGIAPAFLKNPGPGGRRPGRRRRTARATKKGPTS